MEYSFNLILCFLVGISIKIYDDITDNKLNVDIYYVELLKYFLITLFSIIFYNDVVFSTLFFVISKGLLYISALQTMHFVFGFLTYSSLTHPVYHIFLFKICLIYVYNHIIILIASSTPVF